MMFLINQTLKNIKKHLGINIVIALTLFVAYLFFFMICCHVEDGMLGVSSFSLKDMDRSIYFYGQARQLQRQASIVGGVERMSYLLHRAILRVRKGKRKYIPMALQIIVGVCLLSLSISLSFSLLKQMWEFSSYMKIPFAGVSTEIGDNSTKIT